MDLIYTDSKRIDQGVLSSYAFDLSFGVDENNFEMTIGTAEAMLEYGAFVYIEGTEYGGIVDAKRSRTNEESITYKGRTWHGIMNSKVIQPDSGESYLVVSGDANEVLSFLIDRLGLSELFVADEIASGVNVTNYKFRRYCKGYDGITAMLKDNGAKLKIAWKNRAVVLSAVPIVDYTEQPLDGDMADLTLERHEKKVNHLICLGRGELTDREIVHLYVNESGEICDTQYYTGLDEYSDTYDNNGSENLRSDGEQYFKEIRGTDTVEMDLLETENPVYDIGDIVGATDNQTGMGVASAVTQKIVRINNGAISTEYKTGS